MADGHKSQNTVFFFSFERYQHALKLQVTDLVYIWTAAKTSKAELIEEAIRTRCNIDPSEDDEQYEVLVTKLEEAVSGRDGASCLLVPDQKTSNPVRFEMKTTIPLPAPLGTLEWTFQMVRQEPSIFTQELVIPALRVIDASRRREEDLRRRIKEKDHVIGKLMDKIEGAGIDLSMVFPGFAGARKGLNARQAAMVVPGIEAFRDGESGRYWKDGDDIGLNGLVDALKAPETGSLVWEVPLRPTREPNGGPPDQVPASLFCAKKHWLTRQSKDLSIMLPCITMTLTHLNHPFKILEQGVSQALQAHRQPLHEAERPAQSGG